MGIAYHTTYAPDGTALNLFDRVVLGTVTAVYGAGTTTGTPTAVAVTWAEPIPTPYAAIASPIEDAAYFISGRTSTGFTLTATPRVLATTLTGGSVEIVIIS